MLRSVSGIGPKIALAILSTLDARSLRQTVLTNRVELLESVPGIGKRTAEKLMLELRPKMEKLSFVSPKLVGATIKIEKKGEVTTSQDFDEFSIDSNQLSDVEKHILDLRSALENLGYKDKEITPVVNSMRSEFSKSSDVNFQLILKSALKSMRANV
jgi:holliday junction DNA helicase RuvA